MRLPSQALNPLAFHRVRSQQLVTSCCVCRAPSLHAMQDVAEVEIDGDGTFKYVLLRLQSRGDASLSRLLVRGNARAGYHRDVLERSQELDADADCQVCLASLELHGILSIAVVTS